MSKIEIVRKTHDYIVCLKKPGMLAEKSGSSPSVPLFAEEALAEMGEKNKLFTVHRLDRPVGGLTLLARSPKAASYFAEQVQNGVMVKKYLAVVSGVVTPSEGIYEDLLFRDASKNKTYVVDRMRKGVRDAKLEYRVIAVKEALSLVEVTLHTGRTHQIRVQFASRKTPLVGDGRYGSGDHKDLPALFAYSLTFQESSKSTVNVKAKPEEVYPWSLFKDELSSL